MSAKIARFLEADVKRAMTAAQKSGERSYRVDIQIDGTISIIVGTSSIASKRRNSCDDILDK